MPLLLRSYELYDRLCQDSGVELIRRTGGLYFGPPDSVVVAGSIRSARQWDLAHEVLDAREIRRRFPTFTPGEGGFVDPFGHLWFVGDRSPPISR